jgi:hypothetical protein
VRPTALETRAIAREPIQLRGEEDELARAIVLRHRIGSARIHAAWHLPAVELMGRVEVEVPLGRCRVPQPQQRLAHHGSIADPGACVRAGSGSQHVPIAAEQDVRQARPQCVHQRAALFGHLEPHAVELLAPVCRDRLARATELVHGRDRASPGCSSLDQGALQAEAHGCSRLDRNGIAEQPRSHAGRIIDPHVSVGRVESGG